MQVYIPNSIPISNRFRFITYQAAINLMNPRHSGTFCVLPMIKRVFILHTHILRNNEKAGRPPLKEAYCFFSHFVFLLKSSVELNLTLQKFDQCCIKLIRMGCIKSVWSTFDNDQTAARDGFMSTLSTHLQRHDGI